TMASSISPVTASSVNSRMSFSGIRVLSLSRLVYMSFEGLLEEGFHGLEVQQGIEIDLGQSRHLVTHGEGLAVVRDGRDGLIALRRLARVGIRVVLGG